MANLTVDVDSLPVVVHGHQPGSMHNGNYHDRLNHPLIASAGEWGDMPGGRLRCGNVHTADDAEAFILQMLDQVEAKICVRADLRIDAGFPSESLRRSATTAERSVRQGQTAVTTGKIRAIRQPQTPGGATGWMLEAGRQPFGVESCYQDVGP